MVDRRIATILYPSDTNTPMETVLIGVDMRVRRIVHHWNQDESWPNGRTPMRRIWSVTQMDAHISSTVLAARPRIAPPAIA